MVLRNYDYCGQRPNYITYALGNIFVGGCSKHRHELALYLWKIRTGAH